jgi:tetratricopeptide (TPR) repeat protein
VALAFTNVVLAMISGKPIQGARKPEELPTIRTTHEKAVLAQAGISPGLAAWILVVAIVLAYSNSFQVAFVFDDHPSILENVRIQNFLTIRSAMFPDECRGDTLEGRPLLALSIATNFALSGSKTWSYHAVNLIIHLGATLTLFGLVRRTLLLPRFRGNYATRANWLALAVATVWGLHPLQTESVTYIIQRAESLVSLFYLLTIYCIARGNLAQQRLRWFLLGIVCCAAGMASKEVMITAPVMALFYERVFVFRSWRELAQRRWRFYLALMATWGILAACILPLGGRGGTAGLGHGVTSWNYLVTQARAIVTYLRLAIIPSNLVLDYGKQLVTDLSEVMPQAFLIVMLLVATVWALSRWSPLGYLGAWFFAVLSPTSSIIPIITQTIAEHRVYLALAGPVTLVVMLADVAWQRFKDRLPRPYHTSAFVRHGPLALLLGVATVLGYCTWLRNLDYRTQVSIWHDTVDKQPNNSRAQLNLAMALADAGDDDSAVEIINQIIAMEPRNAGAYYQRGRLLLDRNQLDAAYADLSRSIEIKPLAGALQNRGLVHCRRGEFELAIQDLDQAVALEPGLRVVYRNRALAHYVLKRYHASLRDIRHFRALGGSPDDELARVEAILAHL